MTPVTKAQWIEALRSDKYTQGQGNLIDCDNKMCCLGVLCDLSGITGVPGSGYDFFELIGPQYINSLPPWAVSKRIVSDLNLNNGLTADSNDSLKTILATLNDGGWSFDDIADYLESLP